MSTVMIVLIVVAATSIIAAVAYNVSEKFETFSDAQLAKLKKLFKRGDKKKSQAEVDKKNVTTNVAAKAPEVEKAVREPKVKKEGLTWKEKLAVFAGAPLDLYRSVPMQVQNKAWQLGATTLTVVLFSAFIAGLVYYDIWGAVAALIALVVMFWIVRAIEIPLLQTFNSDWIKQINEGKNPKALSRAMFFPIMLRIVLVFAISSINTTFILMKVFAPECKVKIEETREGLIHASMDTTNTMVARVDAKKEVYQKNYTAAESAYKAIFEKKRERIARMEENVQKRQDKLIGEIEGKVGSGLAGDGIAAAEDRRLLNQDTTELGNLRRAFVSSDTTIGEYRTMMIALADRDKAFVPLDKEIVELKARGTTKVAELKAAKMDGLEQRMKALQDVSKDSKLYWLYAIFFFVVECLPFVIKMAQGPDTLTKEMAKQVAEYEQQNFHEAQRLLLSRQIAYELEVEQANNTIIQNRRAANENYSLLAASLKKSQAKFFQEISDDISELKERLADLKKNGTLTDIEVTKFLGQVRSEYLLTKRFNPANN